MLTKILASVWRKNLCNHSFLNWRKCNLPIKRNKTSFTNKSSTFINFVSSLFLTVLFSLRSTYQPSTSWWAIQPGSILWFIIMRIIIFSLRQFHVFVLAGSKNEGPYLSLLVFVQFSPFFLPQSLLSGESNLMTSLSIQPVCSLILH